MIAMYLAILFGYVSKLQCPISDQAMFSNILKNIYPFYHDRLRDGLLGTLSVLRDTCKCLEARRGIING